MKRFIGFIKVILAILIVASGTFLASVYAEGNIVAAFEGSEYSVVVGRNITVTPVIQNFWGQKTFSYTSADESIATVSAWGSVTGISAGTTTIFCTVTAGEKVFELSYKLVVNQLITSLKFAESKIVLSTNEIYTPQLIIEPANATDTTILFEISDSRVASLQDDCSLQGEYIGQCSLTARAQDGSGAVASVTVEVPMVTVSETNVVIDDPEGVDFVYCVNRPNLSSISTSIGVSGDCFTFRSVKSQDTEFEPRFGFEYWGKAEKIHLIPIKPGYGSFVVTINGRSASIPVQVTRNAGYEERPFSYYTQWCNGEGLRFSIGGKVQEIDYLISKDENGGETRTVQFTLLAENKVGQYATCAISEKDFMLAYEEALSKENYTVEELEGKDVTFKGIYRGLVDYTAANGLQYSIPSFDVEKWELND